MRKLELKTTASPQMRCRTTVRKLPRIQLYSFTVMLARIICFVSCGICFTSICSFILSSWHHYDIIATFRLLHYVCCIAFQLLT